MAQIKESVGRPGDPSGSCDALGLRELAHELNSMLDGSLRCVELARRAIASAAGAAGDDEHMEAVADRLDHAREAMRAMAALLERAMRAETADVLTAVDEQRPLGEEIRRLVEQCSAHADQSGVSIDFRLAKAAASIPAGPLGPVILNGLRNAIEACEQSPPSSRRVEVSLGMLCGGQLELLIADTGPGVSADFEYGRTTKPHGHGIGLELSRTIAESLGGRAELMNVPFGGGAVLRVVVPVKRLQQT